MKRFLVFTGDEHYPNGGWDDFVGSFDTLAEAMDRLILKRADWGQIVDSQTGDIIKRTSYGSDGEV